ncbi:MAG: hypothetical protein R3C03_20985 [Pirellulaceae bacterium]
MRSVKVCFLLAAVALMGTGCRVTVSQTGDCCGVMPGDRCSTQFQDRCVNGLFRPFAGLRGAACDAGCDAGCDTGCGIGMVASGCGCNGGVVGQGCGCDGGSVDCGCGGAVSTGCGCEGTVDAGCGCNGLSLGTGLRGRFGGMGMACGSCGSDSCNGFCGESASGLAGLTLPRLGGGQMMAGGCSIGDCSTGDCGVSLAGYQDGYGMGCGHFGCGEGGRLCMSCRLKGMLGRRGLIRKAIPGNGMAANHPYGGMVPHTEPIPAMGPESGAPTYAYPYYTVRGPRDFLQANPPTIGY